MIYSGKSWYWRKLSGAYKVVKMSAQKAAQGAPRAEMVAVHQAMMQMGLHPQKCFLPVLPLPPWPRVHSLVPTVRLTVLKRNVLAGRSDILVRRLTADLVPTVFLALSVDWQ